MKNLFERNSEKSRMIIYPDNKDIVSSYEFAILEHNEIPGLLSPEIRTEPECISIAYDISGMQSIKNIADKKSLGYMQIRKLILSLGLLPANIKKYLLSEDGLLISPEYIYISNGNRDIKFCYLPEAGMDTASAVSELLSYILNRTEPGDKRAIMLVYSLYQESLKDNCVMQNLVEVCNEYNYEKTDAEAGIPYMLKDNEDRDSGIRDKETGLNEKKHKRIESSHKASQDLNRKQENAGGENKEQNNTVTGIGKWKLGGLFRSNAGDKKPGVKKYILRAQDRGLENISIDYFPYVIGSRERICDYVLDMEQIAPMHIRIDKKAESLYIRDLSGDGSSSLNGYKLSGEDGSMLNAGDSIGLGEILYIFEEH